MIYKIRPAEKVSIYEPREWQKWMLNFKIDLIFSFHMTYEWGTAALQQILSCHVKYVGHQKLKVPGNAAMSQILSNKSKNPPETNWSKG